MRRLSQGRHDRSIVISGLRGVGKTVLLGEINDRALEYGWRTSEVE
jgi:predicted AAA+ superfamily ATPase